MKKILFTIPSTFPYYSKFPRLLDICKILPDFGYFPIVSVDHIGRLHEEGVEILQSYNIPVIILRMNPHRSNFIRSLFDLLKTIKWLRKNKISIQHSFDYSSLWIEPIISKLGGVKYWIASKTNENTNSINWVIRLLLADVITVQAPQIKKRIVNTIPFLNKKIIQINNGVHFIDNIKTNTNYNDFKMNHSDKLILGSVGHIILTKNYYGLIKAISMVNNKDIHYLIIGEIQDVPYYESLKKFIVEHNLYSSITFVGIQRNMKGWYSIMDGLILVSKSESLANTVLEGMEMGLPIISTDVGGMSEVVKQGENGWLIKFNKTFNYQVSLAIEEWAINSTKRRKYGLKSKQIINDNFSTDSMIQNHIDMYNKILNTEQNE